MFIQLLAFALTVATTGSPSSRQEASIQKPVSIGTAVAEFNTSNQGTADWAGQGPLTEQELLAALAHEKKTLSADAQKTADEIIDSRTLPSGVRLQVFTRRFADRHATYLYQIKLSFDKEPVRDELGNVVDSRRQIESLTIRKHYLATQRNSGRQELKSLDELLAETGS